MAEVLEPKRELDCETQNKVSFMVFIIGKFASAYKMEGQEAYLYLKKYGGIDYLDEFWWTLHTENPFCFVWALYEECYRNGGLK
jgi:hypothetical protein